MKKETIVDLFVYGRTRLRGRRLALLRVINSDGMVNNIFLGGYNNV